MTKEALERIKQAYYSGLKVQIWFNGHWENFDARDYSMYADPFSENRQYRIVGSAYADIAEKRIEKLEKENAELDCQKNRNKSCYSCANATERCFRNEIGCPCQKYKSYKDEITELKEKLEQIEKENAELKEKLKPENCLKLLAKEGYIKFSSDQLTYAKTIIQDLLDNTDEYARQRAEDFLKENK